MDNYRQAFQEEAREILLELESALLDLNENRDDTELVGRVFRAMHTIKGSGAMFGFDEIAAFTHHIENAYDLVRNGRLSASSDLISLSLTAVDRIKGMLDEAMSGKPSNQIASEQILVKLRDIMGEPAIAAGKPAIKSQVEQKPLAGTRHKWHIRLDPKPDFLWNGTDPLLLFRELRQMGDLETNADTSAVPEIEDMDPTCCYVAWNIVLTTTASLEDIRDVFMFVEDSCELTIERQPDTPLVAEVLSPEKQADKRPAEKRPSQETAAQTTSIRVAAPKLDQFVDLVGQLVTVQARLTEIAARYEDRDLQAVAEEIEGLTAELRDNSMSMRTLPLRPTFERFKRLVYDLGRSLHKEVELTFEGEDTDLDKTVIDQLGDPLMHLIRNSMDHGIGSAEQRTAAGKQRVGNIHLSARYAGAQVLICVSDDGEGIDREAVRARAVEKGLITSDARLSEAEVYALILAPGFSTAQAITDISGRGVGMDVVRRNVEALRGSIEITSQVGVGSKITLRLPLTLAIIDGLLVRVGTNFFVMPLADTVECVELTRQDIERANGKRMANIRGEVIPYIRLSEHLKLDTGVRELEQLMVAETEQGRFGFVVDEVLGHHQTVIKNLGRLYRNIHFISGATILGDGTLALILDLHRLVQDEMRTSATKTNKSFLPQSALAQSGNVRDALQLNSP